MRKCRAVVLVAGLLAKTATAQHAWRTPGEDEAATARQLAAAGRCAEALDPFDRAVETRTEDPTLRRDRGLCHERLGHPDPAIEDYRAYLSMAGTAADAGPIRARLGALEAASPAQQPVLPAPRSTDRRGNDPPEASAQSDASRRRDADAAGFLLGFHLSDRAWQSSGYSTPTAAYGAVLGYSFLPRVEADVRLVWLSTNVDNTSGYGASLGGTWKLAPADTRGFEFAVGLEGGLESQSNDRGVARAYWFGRVTPALRVVPLPSLVISLGPHLALGSIRKAATSAADQAESSVSAVSFGGTLELLWMLRSRSQSE